MIGVLALQGDFEAHAAVLRRLGADPRVVRTPADAALMMQLGAEGVFVGSGIFKSETPAVRAAAIVEATTHFDDPDRVARASRGLGAAMAGLEISDLEAPGGTGLMQHRGW